MSDIIETAAVGNATMGPFLNAAIGVRTAHSPNELLHYCLDIESKHGRVRLRNERWHSRTLDLDLLLYGDRVIDEAGLLVPHPRLHERAFALMPLLEIAPDIDVPGRGRAADLLAAVAAQPVARLPR